MFLNQKDPLECKKRLSWYKDFHQNNKTISTVLKNVIIEVSFVMDQLNLEREMATSEKRAIARNI